MGACFGGSLTLVSAAANVAAAGIDARSGTPIGVLQVLEVGVPVTLLSMVPVTRTGFFAALVAESGRGR